MNLNLKLIYPFVITEFSGHISYIFYFSKCQMTKIDFHFHFDLLNVLQNILLALPVVHAIKSCSTYKCLQRSISGLCLLVEEISLSGRHTLLLCTSISTSIPVFLYVHSVYCFVWHVQCPSITSNNKFFQSTKNNKRKTVFIWNMIIIYISLLFFARTKTKKKWHRLFCLVFAPFSSF